MSFAISQYEIQNARQYSKEDIAEALGNLTTNDCDRIAHFVSQGRIHESGAAMLYGINKYFERTAKCVTTSSGSNN